MNAYEHFGLRAPPFEAIPDPRFYFRCPTHEETRATLEYTARTHRGCCVILGDSGAGKTLLARMLCRSIDPQTTLLWCDGLEQTGRTLAVSVLTAGALEQPGAAPTGEHTTLSDWLRTRSAGTQAQLLIIDNADELPRKAWRHVVGLLSSQTSAGPHTDLAVFGLPALKHTLASPDLLRLRRRIFRTYVLPALSEEQVRQYIQHRLATAGGEGTAIFSDDAITQIHRLTRGIPGLINQVCDNALIDAYGEDRRRIEPTDVWVAIHTIVGGHLGLRHGSKSLPWTGGGPPAQLPPVPSADVEAVGPGHPHPSLPTVLARASRRLAATTTLEAFPDEEDPNVVGRLRNLEGRLAHALRAVREARLLRADVVNADAGPPDRANPRVANSQQASVPPADAPTTVPPADPPRTTA